MTCVKFINKLVHCAIKKESSSNVVCSLAFILTVLHDALFTTKTEGCVPPFDTKKGSVHARKMELPLRNKLEKKQFAFYMTLFSLNSMVQ